VAEASRKSGETLESYAERLIREAQEEGEFDHLPRGKPLPLSGGPLPESWWAKEKLRREKLSDLPESIAILQEAERTLAEVAREADERVVRERLEALDARIRTLNATHVAGPPTTLAPLDVERVLARWREARQGAARSPTRRST
jgi:DnaJ-like protein